MVSASRRFNVLAAGREKALIDRRTRPRQPDQRERERERERDATRDISLPEITGEGESICLISSPVALPFAFAHFCVSNG